MTKLKIAFSNYTKAPNLQPFNVVEGIILCLPSDAHKTHK